MDQNVNIAKEADKAFKKGKEALTTGVFQWKKDYNLGAMHFEDAAKLYKQAKNPLKEREALQLSIQCNEKLNDPWAVARNYEAIIASSIDNQADNYQELFDLTRRSGEYFKASDSGMKTLQLYVKVSKYLSLKQQIPLAETLIQEAMNEADEQQAPSTKTDILNQYIEILVDTQRYSKAADLYQKECENHKEEYQKYPLNQYALIVVIMYILQDEIIRANAELEQLIINVPNFHKSSEFRACDQMINSYEKGDQNQFNEVITKATITCIYPPNIVRALRKIKVRMVNVHVQKVLQQDVTDEEQQKQIKSDLDKMIL